MLKTKRQLDAENKALRARVEAQGGDTRKALNARVKAAEKRVRELEAELAKAKGGAQ